jgi:cell division protease FtsH
MDGKWFRNSFIWLIIMLFVLAIAFQVFRGTGGHETAIPATGKDSLVSRVQGDVKSGKPITITQDGSSITLQEGSNTSNKFTTSINSGQDVLTFLKDAGVRTGSKTFTNDVQIKYSQPSQLGNWIAGIFSFLPILIFGALIFFMMRQAQGSNNQALSFGKSRARMFAGNRPTITFADVAGVEEAKQELAEVVEFLKYPDKFAALGARIPRGVLLVGPPGTGKTLLSRAVAGEAGVPFFSISGSEFVEMFVGVGASRVRDLFDQAKRNAPCIVFVDEIDAVGRQRGAGLGGSHDEREQTLNQILVEMDGFDTNTNVIVIAATNRPDVLDPALLRPGRFDRQVVLDNPDIRGRLQVLEVHARGKPFEKNVNLQTLAKQTPGFSGADLSNLLNEAAILSARRNKKAIGMGELEEAIDRVISGPERKSRIISDKEKAITAYHEVGHALVARMLPNLDPVHKITIVARGLAGGYTRLLPTEDRYLYTESQFRETLAFALGGHAAEQLIFGEVTTGASNDIERATGLSRQMVTQYGMSQKLGPRAFGKKEELVFLGREIGEQRNYSEAVAQEIDNEIRNLINEAYGVAREILVRHKDKLVTVSERLIAEETIEGPVFDEIMGLTEVAMSYEPGV